MKWDAEKFSKSCEFAALSAERYANELDRRKDKGSCEKDLYDEHNAKFSVYYYFVGRSFTDTKEHFLAEAERLREIDPICGAVTVYDRERYKMHWKNYLNDLIKSVRNEN
jgi:hypothetical protein